MNKMFLDTLLILPLVVVADDMEEAFQNSLSSNPPMDNLLPIQQLVSSATNDPHDLMYISVRCSALYCASQLLNGVGAEENLRNSAEPGYDAQRCSGKGWSTLLKTSRQR